MSKKTRTVEMYVGVHEGNAQTWFTEFVDIPADTPEDKVGEVAEKKLLRRLEKTDLQVAFVGVYNDSYEEDEDDYPDGTDQWLDDADERPEGHPPPA